MDSWTQTLADKENANPRVNSSTRQTSRKGPLASSDPSTIPGQRCPVSVLSTPSNVSNFLFDLLTP